MRNCLIVRHGLVDYNNGLALQKEARQRVADGAYQGILVLLEHPPVITIGRGGGNDNLCVAPEWLQQSGVEVLETDRGGNITSHSPGQLVGYPILNLHHWRQDIHWYVDSLEQVIIQTLRRFGVRAGRKAKYTGVWVGNKKICAIGISVRHWITGHGFALNVNNPLDLFKVIIPCGIAEFGVTSLAALDNSSTVDDIAAGLIQEFCNIFDADSSLSVVKGGEYDELRTSRPSSLVSTKSQG